MGTFLTGNNSVPGGGAGVGSQSSSQGSVTKSGISGIAGEQSVRTGDASSAGTLAKEWNTQSAIKDVQNQAQITQQFSQNAAREIGNYAGKQAKELRDQANQETDPDKRQALQDQAAQWDEGGAYRVALHSAAGLLSGGMGGLLANGVTASAMPLIGEQITSLGLPGPVEQALGAVTAATIGGLIGGTSGASAAFSTDINNRQLHPTERAKLKETSKKVAREQIPDFDRLTPEQQAKAESYWYDQLAQAALARVDDKGAAAWQDQLGNAAATDRLGLQGGFSAQQYLADAQTAERVVAELASQNQPIHNIYGEPVKAGLDPLIAFNATSEQRANSLLLNTPTEEAERQRIAQANRDTLSYLNAVSGGADRDYMVEEFLLGGPISSRAVKTIAEVVESAGKVLQAARSSIRTGAYEGSSVLADDAAFAFREVELRPKSGSLRGEPEAPRANASREDVRGISRQNEAAETLSQHGVDVEQLPNNQGKTGTKQPDLKINGELADVYCGFKWRILDGFGNGFGNEWRCCGLACAKEHSPKCRPESS